MHWFHIPHALLVILIVSQISAGLSNEEVEENSTWVPTTTMEPPSSQDESTEDEQPQITRRFMFKKPPASAYQPTKRKKPKHIVHEIQVPIPAPAAGAAATVLVPHWPVAPVASPIQPQVSVAMHPPKRIRRPTYRPAPSVEDFLPSAISGLTNMIIGGGAPPPAGGAPPGGGLGPLGDLLGPLSGLIKPALSLLGPLAKSLAGANPFIKTLLDLCETIKKVMSFFTDFSLSKLFSFIPNLLKRIMTALCKMFSCIPRFLDRLCRLLGNIFKMIPKSVMLIPRFFRCLHKLPERIVKCIEFLYRLCKAIEMFLAYLKQVFWNMLRLLGNTVLLPLKIISKTVTEVIYLPIKLLSEPFFAFTELLRAILYPFRKLYHFVMIRIDYIVEELYIFVRMLFGYPCEVHAVAPVQKPIPLIRVFPKLLLSTALH